MAKANEKRLAKIYYINQGKTAKEISELLSITEKTISNWINNSTPNWKDLRNAKMVEKDMLEKDFRELINTLVEQRIEINKDEEADPKDKYKITMEIAMLRSEYQKIVKSDSVSLEKYLWVMEQIFNAIQQEHPEIFLKLIDFQERHINEIAVKLA